MTRSLASLPGRGNGSRASGRADRPLGRPHDVRVTLGRPLVGPILIRLPLLPGAIRLRWAQAASPALAAAL